MQRAIGLAAAARRANVIVDICLGHGVSLEIGRVVQALNAVIARLDRAIQ
jgi:hypothetical protein